MTTDHANKEKQKRMLQVQQRTGRSGYGPRSPLMARFMDDLGLDPADPRSMGEVYQDMGPETLNQQLRPIPQKQQKQSISKSAGDRIQRREPEPEQTGEIRPVVVTVTATEVGTGIVGSYPDASGDNYVMPLYRVTVSGTNAAGESVTSNFTAIRYGVEYRAGTVGPKVVGLSDAQTHVLNWVGYMGGSWQVYGNHLIHDGADDPTTQAWGAIGCVEINYAGEWDRFNTLIHSLTGSSDKGAIGDSGNLTVHFEEVSSRNRPTLVVAD